MEQLILQVLSDPDGSHRWMVMQSGDENLPSPVAVAGRNYPSFDDAHAAGTNVLKNILTTEVRTTFGRRLMGSKPP